MITVNYPIQKYPFDILDEIPIDQQLILPTSGCIKSRKYATSIDPRGAITVYEYKLGENWIMWDYHTGMVHLTGLWKAIGNTKADIVKLVETSPELEPLLKRIRGGYLKIQGTWVPFHIARILASKFCYNIRYALIPLFGAIFKDQCLKPCQPGFGMLRLHITEADLRRRKRRRRRHSAPSLIGSNKKKRKHRSALPKTTMNHGHHTSLKPVLPPPKMSKAYIELLRSKEIPYTSSPYNYSLSKQICALPIKHRNSDGIVSVLLAAQSSGYSSSSSSNTNNNNDSGYNHNYTTTQPRMASLIGQQTGLYGCGKNTLYSPVNTGVRNAVNSYPKFPERALEYNSITASVLVFPHKLH